MINVDLGPVMAVAVAEVARAAPTSRVNKTTKTESSLEESEITSTRKISNLSSPSMAVSPTSGWRRTLRALPSSTLAILNMPLRLSSRWTDRN